MKSLLSRSSLTFLLLLVASSCLFAQTLKLATANIWSGLDYRGVLRVGEFEHDSVRNARINLLAANLRKLDADVIALQEVNPLGSVSSFLAGELGYTCITQRANSGIKLGPLGIPTNLNEGLAILAKPELDLTLVDVWDVSESFGLFGNTASFHFSDRNIALIARVRKEKKSVTIVNVHLASHPPNDEQARKQLERILGERQQEKHAWFEELTAGGLVRERQMREIVERIKEMRNGNVVLLGDLNASVVSPEVRMLRDNGFTDVAAGGGVGSKPTWDAENPNVRFSSLPPENSGPLDELAAWYDTQSRRIDYIFAGPWLRKEDIRSVGLFLDEPGEVVVSDHYGVFADIDISSLQMEEERVPDPEFTLEGLPILTYDTDVGFGYGVKGFLLNPFGGSESIDLIAFNSTKGERWYRFVFSMPDFELRQGREYPFAFDLIADYDKFLKNNFFGVGNSTRESAGEIYTKEPLEIQAVASMGWSSRVVGQIGVKVRTVRNFNYSDTSAFARSLPTINHGRSQALTLFGSVRYDSRDSFVNPSRGQVVQFDAEIGDDGFLSDYSVFSGTLALQTYHVLFYPKTVFAARLLGQVVDGKNLPVHALASLGGNRTLRGFPQDRFLDRTAVVANLELRFPLFWRFGGVLLYDRGRVAPSAGKLPLFTSGWHTNTGFGLRLLMETFVVRADLGFSGEGTGFYLNFGHVF